MLCSKYPHGTVLDSSGTLTRELKLTRILLASLNVFCEVVLGLISHPGPKTFGLDVNGFWVDLNRFTIDFVSFCFCPLAAPVP